MRLWLSEIKSKFAC